MKNSLLTALFFLAASSTFGATKAELAKCFMHNQVQVNSEFHDMRGVRTLAARSFLSCQMHEEGGTLRKTQASMTVEEIVQTIAASIQLDLASFTNAYNEILK